MGSTGLAEKLLLLVAYVGGAEWAFKRERNRQLRMGCTWVTCILFVMIFYIAETHVPILAQVTL
ncbi:SirB2 family protein, partial [Vibrio vulnificus]|uniref:SirB2 family protein n=1 Tax=Vibrio vulnificus TaxID=672 RepID=UPI00237A69D1